MDVIRISDAALASSKVSPVEGPVQLKAQEEDSIDLIDRELRAMLASKTSDSDKWRSQASKFTSDHSKDARDKQAGKDKADDHFADVIEQMELAINAESLKPGKEFAEEVQEAQVNRVNSKWANRKEMTVLEKRRTLVKGRPPSGSTDKENWVPTAQKVSSPKEWGVIDGKRFFKQSQPNHLVPLSGQELKSKETILVPEEGKQEELSFSIRADTKSKETTSIRVQEHSGLGLKKLEAEIPIKKPKLHSEESYIIDGSLGVNTHFKPGRLLKQQAKPESKKLEPAKEEKISVQAALLSPIARRTEETDTKVSVQQLFCDQESSPLRHLNSGQKEELAKCSADLKLAELKTKFNFLLKNVKDKDCLVFIKLVMEVMKEFQNEKHTIKAKSQYLEIITELETTSTKVKELSKMIQSLNMSNDTKLASAIIEN
jgi:hypothetical protein